jgi:hypothetical protein
MTRTDQDPLSGYFSSFEELAAAGFQIKSEEPIKADMPKPEAAFAMVQGIVAEVFDTFRNTRLEANGARLAWGIINAFHHQVAALSKAEDSAGASLAVMIGEGDSSEIGSTRLEDQQLHCKSLEEARAAFECMLDHGASLYLSETGQPWQPFAGSRSAGKMSAAMIDAKDYLAARQADKRSAHHPQGPVVLFSGGTAWADYTPIYQALNDARALIPNMVLVTTAQRTGADAIAAAWAAANKVQLIAYALPKGLGRRAGFVRNDKMIGLKPVQAIIAEGTGVQANLSQKCSAAAIPRRILRMNAEQKAAASAPAKAGYSPAGENQFDPFADARTA